MTSNSKILQFISSVTYRQTNVLIAIACALLIATALYMQYEMGMPPCPLCITQRIFIVVVGIFALLAAIHNPPALGRNVYGVLAIIAALVGAGVSLRHVWIQGLPEDLVPACGPDLAYMFDAFPLFDALRLLFQGDGNCADISWQLLGLSMPAWVAICYAGLIVVNIWQLLRARQTEA